MHWPAKVIITLGVGYRLEFIYFVTHSLSQNFIWCKNIDIFTVMRPISCETNWCGVIAYRK